MQLLSTLFLVLLTFVFEVQSGNVLLTVNPSLSVTVDVKDLTPSDGAYIQIEPTQLGNPQFFSASLNFG